jgi:hypothetical protein
LDYRYCVMMKKLKILYIFVAIALLASCSDDDDFSTSPSNLLTFSSDTIHLDTVFSNVGSATRSFWVYNNSSSGIRCSDIRLEGGSSSAFRVNVDGIDLTNIGSTADIEIRKSDSIRVFVEATPSTQNANDPQNITDNLVFTLESGEQQRVNLDVWSWDALFLRDHHVTSEETLTAEKPLVVYGGLTVDSGAVLNLQAGTTLYFHGDAGLSVYGKINSQGEAGNNVTLRGDRLDRMFAYLPYDLTPGQWQGVVFHASSTDNQLVYTDIHSTYDGIVIDSCDASPLKLQITASTIHTCQGYGLISKNARVNIESCQITNTLNDCVYIDGGNVTINSSTLAQFYPFDSNRGYALNFSNSSPLEQLNVTNCLITGYADDVLLGVNDTTLQNAFNFAFDHCLIRTPKPTTEDSLLMTNMIYENPEDTTTGSDKHFKKIDIDSLRYDFRLDSLSQAIDAASTETSYPTDRDGSQRDEKPDMGAFEYIKPTN